MQPSTCCAPSGLVLSNPHLQAMNGHLGDLLTMITNHLLNGMILQVHLLSDFAGLKETIHPVEKGVLNETTQQPFWEMGEPTIRYVSWFYKQRCSIINSYPAFFIECFRDNVSLLTKGVLKNHPWTVQSVPNGWSNLPARNPVRFQNVKATKRLEGVVIL